MIIRLLKRAAVLLAVVFAAQGCAIYFPDGDDFHHHREHWRHEHSSRQTNQSAKRADGDQMAANQNSLDSEHQNRVKI